MPPLSDLDHYKIETEILGDENEVVNYEYITNARLGLRNAKIERRWYRQANIGQGSSSDVWLEVQRGNPEAKRAVKAISKRRLLENNIDYKGELKALTEFSKPKYRQKGVFVDFLGWWDNHDSVFLAMEYFPLGNLEDHLSSGPPYIRVSEMTIQLLEGLEIMHAEGFAHRDLKPANIFVVQKDPKWWVKIGDFGISKRIQNQDTSLRTFTGTHDYMAPEFFGYVDDIDEERSDYTHAVDIWALGCVVYRVCTGKVPFPSYPNLRPLQRYCSGQFAPPEEALQSTWCHEKDIDLIMSLLSPKPTLRPSADTLLAMLDPSRKRPRGQEGSALEAKVSLSEAQLLDPFFIDLETTKANRNTQFQDIDALFEGSEDRNTQSLDIDALFEGSEYRNIQSLDMDDLFGGSEDRNTQSLDMDDLFGDSEAPYSGVQQHPISVFRSIQDTSIIQDSYI